MNWTSAMNGWDERDARLTVKARELRPGDYLIGSRRTVDYVEALRGSRVRVDTTTATGKKLSGTWRSGTSIGIRRQEVGMRTEDFKMGDRVRVIGPTQHGREGRVDKIAPQLVQFPILVVFDHSNSGVFGFAPHELELQQPTKEAS